MRRCSEVDCGTCWLDPAPAPEAIGDLYRSYYTHRATRPDGLIRRLYLRGMRGLLADRLGYPIRDPLGRLLGRLFALDPDRVDQILHSVGYLRHRPSGRVLDVGCGEGSRVERLRDLGWIAAGVDFDAAALEAGRRRGLDLRLGSVESLGEPTASFDAITLSHVIEHVPDPLATLTECHRLLRPGGVLWSATPNVRSEGASRWGAAWRGWEIPRHLQVFSGPALATLVSRAGFEHVHWRTSARIAGTILLESEAPERVRTGGPYSRESRRAASRFARDQRRRLVRDPTIGEEILLEASA